MGFRLDISPFSHPRYPRTVQMQRSLIKTLVANASHSREWQIDSFLRFLRTGTFRRDLSWPSGVSVIVPLVRCKEVYPLMSYNPRLQPCQAFSRPLPASMTIDELPAINSSPSFRSMGFNEASMTIDKRSTTALPHFLQNNLNDLLEPLHLLLNVATHPRTRKAYRIAHINRLASLPCQ